MRREDPTVLILLNRYRRIWGLEPGPVTGEAWRGLTFDGKIVLAYCERRAGTTIIVENVCPANSRMGKLAVYVLMLFYRTMYEQGQVTGILCSVLAKNEAIQQALVRVFGDIGEVDEMGKPVPLGLVFKLGAA
jgi:hypothetical protein